MAESAFNAPFEDDESIKALRELVAGLEGSLSPEWMAEFRNVLTNAFEEEFNAGYRQGVKEAEERASDPDEEARLRGEAKGLAWALTAAKGMPVSPMTNHYVNPNVIKGLLAIGEAGKR